MAFDYLSRIRGLLAKAEGTDNEHEAAAFLAKAHELMVRHSIDEALVRKDGRAERQTPVTRDVRIVPRSVGFQARAELFFAVARSLDLRYWWRPETGLLTVCGFPGDVVQAEALYTSLLLQLENAAQHALSAFQRSGEQVVWDHKRRTWRKLHGRTFRASFMTGYADRVSERLAEMRRVTRRTVVSESSSSALVLRDKKAQVDDWVRTNVTLSRGRSRSSSSNLDGSAYSAGSRAGSHASLGGRGVGPGAGAIGSGRSR